jgi:hypothetical protein
MLVVDSSQLGARSSYTVLAPAAVNVLLFTGDPRSRWLPPRCSASSSWQMFRAVTVS